MMSPLFGAWRTPKHRKKEGKSHAMAGAVGPAAACGAGKHPRRRVGANAAPLSHDAHDIIVRRLRTGGHPQPVKPRSEAPTAPLDNVKSPCAVAISGDAQIFNKFLRI